MKLSIVNYGAGNIKSIQFAFKRLGYDAVLTSDPEVIKAMNILLDKETYLNTLKN